METIVQFQLRPMIIFMDANEYCFGAETVYNGCANNV